MAEIPANKRIELPSGRIISVDDIKFDIADNRFKYGVFDATDLLTIGQKTARSHGRYDRWKANEDAYIASYALEHGGKEPPKTGDMSTWSNFVENVKDNPLGGLGGGKDGLGGIKSLLKNVKFLLILGSVVFIVWTFFPVIRSFAKK